MHQALNDQLWLEFEVPFLTKAETLAEAKRIFDEAQIEPSDALPNALFPAVPASWQSESVSSQSKPQPENSDAPQVKRHWHWEWTHDQWKPVEDL